MPQQHALEDLTEYPGALGGNRHVPASIPQCLEQVAAFEVLHNLALGVLKAPRLRAA
jgi:hypothetical protein